MAQLELAQVFAAKAEESMSGAESEFVNGRYNNTANRCYYACFQAAIATLAREGIQPRGGQWSHAFVQAQFVGQLINRRRLYPPTLRDVLLRNQELRRVADYDIIQVTRREAVTALQRTRTFLAAIQQRGGGVR